MSQPGKPARPAAALLSVAEASARILDLSGFSPRQEIVPLWQADGRVLATDLNALRTQPPFDASAMDGYALRHADLQALPATLLCIGESAAGHAFTGTLAAGQAVRIFTGAPVPAGADTIVLQEDVTREGDSIRINHSEPIGRHIRPRGLDFQHGTTALRAGTRLNAASLGLAAALNHAALPVRHKPRVGILATGDELALPGAARSDDDIICSNSYSVASLVHQAGGEAIDLGIARDSHAELADAVNRAQAANLDCLVTLGGASVGDHDLVQQALTRAGMELGFWKIAMRPGKPLMHGRLGALRILGLPGNPVSSYVCAILFLQPLIRAMLGLDNPGPRLEWACLGAALKANDLRQDYLRASLSEADATSETPLPLATPFAMQDSSMLSLLAAAQCLILRPPHAPSAAPGEKVQIIRL